MALKFKDGFWYWDNGSPISSPAALYSNADGYLLAPNFLPPISDVVCPRSITFTLAGSPDVTVNVVEDGGHLDFNLTANTADPKSADLSGLFFDFTNSKLSTLSVSGPQITQFVTGAGSVINLQNGVNLNGLHVPTFDVGMEFGLAGIGSNHQNIQSENFVLSDTANDLSVNDLHPTGETGTVGVRTLSVGQKLAAVAPYAPTATPDTVTTLEDTSIIIPVSALATDMNSGAILTIGEIGSGAMGPQYGTVTIAPGGQSLIYAPTTLDYEVDGILTGNEDAFQVCVTDNFGGEVTSFVTVNDTPVADTPTVVDNIAAPQPLDPPTLVRFDATVTSGDYATINQGSDYIKSLALALTGTNTSGITITDSAGLLSANLITPPANQGQFTDQIIVSLPADSTFSDTLSFSGTNAETENTGNPATAATTSSQTITADTETTLEDTPITIPIGNLVNGSGMKITQVAPGPLGPQYGTATIAADGQSLTYTPTTLDYEVNGILTGDQDVFQVYSSNGAGNNAVTLLTVKATPVADAPNIVVSAAPGASASDTLITITANSGDFGTSQQGSDFIQNLQLNLTGNDTSGFTLSDSKGLLNTATDTITTTGQPGTFTDTIDVSAPSSLIGSNFDLNDTLGITATNAETEGFGSPATQQALTSQPIQIDFSTANTSADFTTNGQNIWGQGNAFTFDYNKFLGISNGSGGLKTFGGTIGGIVHDPITSSHFGATVHGSISLKAGFQVDLNINGGSYDASLPFNITLDDVYNKTTDTLGVGATDSAQLGTLDTTGPSGSFDLAAVLKAMASFGGEFCVVFCAGTTIKVPPSGVPFGGTKTLLNVSSNNAHESLPLGAGVTLNLTYPQVNTHGSGTTSITSSKMVQGLGLTVDAVDLLLTAIIGSDPLKGSVPGVGTYDLFSANLQAGLDLQQKFDLTNSGLGAELLVGTSQTPEGLLNFGGTPSTIQDVSSLGLNPDGTIPLALNVSVNNPKLQNITNVVPTAGASLTVGKVSLSLLGTHISGTLAHPSVTIPLGSLKIFGNTFPAAFNSQHVSGIHAA